MNTAHPRYIWSIWMSVWVIQQWAPLWMDHSAKFIIDWKLSSILFCMLCPFILDHRLFHLEQSNGRSLSKWPITVIFKLHPSSLVGPSFSTCHHHHHHEQSDIVQQNKKHTRIYKWKKKKLIPTKECSYLTLHSDQNEIPLDRQHQSSIVSTK